MVSEEPACNPLLIIQVFHTLVDDILDADISSFFCLTRVIKSMNELTGRYRDAPMRAECVLAGKRRRVRGASHL